ncbi:MAG: hypothetical protein WDN23_21175 [Edaphobacter sp.]
MDRMLRIVSSGTTKAGDAGMLSERTEAAAAGGTEGVGGVSGVFVGVSQVNHGAAVKGTAEHLALLHVLVSMMTMRYARRASGLRRGWGSRWCWGPIAPRRREESCSISGLISCCST